MDRAWRCSEGGTAELATGDGRKCRRGREQLYARGSETDSGLTHPNQWSQP